MHMEENESVSVKVFQEKSRGAQMVAEMLGMVCHSEYYNQGDQKV